MSYQTGYQNSTRNFVPYVTYTIIAICVMVAAILEFSGDEPFAEFAMNPIAIGVFGEYYRLVTSMFMHLGLLHIGLNMLVLFLVGPALERVLGAGRFIVLYFLSGLGGEVATYMFSSPTTFSVGASGAIYGLIGAAIVGGKKLNINIAELVFLLGINLVFSFMPGWGIDWRAHIGGLVVGMATAWVLHQSFSPRQKTTPWDSVQFDVYGNPIAPSMLPQQQQRLPQLASSSQGAIVTRQILGCLGIVAVLVAGTMWRTTDLQQQFRNDVQRPEVHVAVVDDRGSLLLY